MVFNELKDNLYGSGIEPEIPFAVMKPPKDLTVSAMSDILSENIYNLIRAKYNDGEFFNINSEVFSSVDEKGLSPLAVIPAAAEKSGDKLHFNKASVKSVKKISVVSYSSLVRDNDYRGIYEREAAIPGENNPADDEVKPENAAVINTDISAESGISVNNDNEISETAELNEKDILKGPAFGNLMHTLLEKADYKKNPVFQQL